MRHRGGGVGHHIFKGVEEVFQTSEHEDDLVDADREDAEAEGAAASEAENFIDEVLAFGYEEYDEEDGERQDENEDGEQGCEGTSSTDGAMGELGGILVLDAAAEGWVDEDGEGDGGLGPEDGEFEDQEEGYCGYAPL